MLKSAPSLALSLMFGLGLAACADDGPSATPRTDLEAVALRPVLEPLSGDGAKEPAAVAAVREAAQVAAEADPDANIGLVWRFEPTELQVYRATAVHFSLDSAPAEHPTAACAWNFGDGSPIEKGCQVSHTFHGGQADQVVTLELEDGDWHWTSTRVVPLERLPVVEGLDVEATETLDGLPPAPEPGSTSFRFALIADTAARGGVPEEVATALSQLTGPARPELLIHMGGATLPDEGEAGWDAVQKSLVEPLTKAGIRVAQGLAPAERASTPRLPAPDLEMIDGLRYPERYSFTYKGAFFVVFSASDKDGVSEETLTWLRNELGKARVYDARYVISYLPIHKFSDEHVGSLDKKFRLYELFLRARVTTFFSAAYRAYFKGRYGALPVVSVGAVAGAGGKLAGSDFAQPPSFVIVDHERGVPQRVFAVEGPTFDRSLDEGGVPETVEVYTR
ncbi:MAG: hypothetical protein H6744_02510 [Deltaproteobacteria bacterium]|nr:hypothetical protein [Deltaproteobacteria bacterium]MCB9785544.1 hypothetical protein [Deltaproteobacteria bacterium]